MRVFRLTKRKYAGDLSGKGAALSNNRWNSKGTEILYTADSRALAMAEVMVHLTMYMLPDDYMMMEMDIPVDVSIAQTDIVDVSGFQWPASIETQRAGDAFIRSGETCVLKVPSAVVKGDFNYLINPAHSDAKKIRIIETVPFPFDRRVFK